MKRVLVVQSDIVLAAGVESLLMREKDLDVLVSNTGVKPGLREEFERFRPEVLILFVDPDFSDLQQLINLIKDYPHMRIVALEADGDRASVFDKHDIKIKEANDLISTVRGTADQLFGQLPKVPESSRRKGGT